jgi:hypothetical protein
MRMKGIILAGVLLVSAAPALSQGCAMCYSSAEAASKGGQKAVERGVAVLLIPPLSFMTLGVGMAAWYARKRDLEKQAGQPPAKVFNPE